METCEINNINGLRRISFVEENTILNDLVIKGNPINYLEIANKALNLRYIKVPEIQSKEYYEEIKQFIENCNDDVNIINGLVGQANKEEFLEAERLIQNILEEINPEWSSKQKIAYVHYKMGELISYVPDFKFSGKYINSPVANNARNIWKSLVEGRSVCNGVTSIQRNILARLGIETQELSSGTHSFMLSKTEEGNIITDATWDLSNTLYQAKPQYFGVTYENLRKQEQGISNAHRLKVPPENVIDISDKELREIYHSIGLTNEDRTFKFPILKKIEEINSKEFISLKEKLDLFFNIVTQDFSKETSHLSETRSILEQCLDELGVREQDITTKFVYKKEDKDSENPFLIIHLGTKELKDKVKIFNNDLLKFEDKDIEEFDEQYKIHEFDTVQPFWKEYLSEKSELESGKNLKQEEEEKYK